MLKKTITYTDFDDVERTEDFYFNLSQSELVKMETGQDLSMTDYINRIIDAKDGPKILELFDKLLRMSYGVKTDDGKKFIKNEALTEEFLCSAAYDALYMSLFAGEDAEGKLAQFIEGILPSKLVEKAKAEGLYPTTVKA